MVSPERIGAMDAQGKKQPSKYLRQLYHDFDGLHTGGAAPSSLVAEVGASQIVLGTDYPFPWTKTAVEHVLSIPGCVTPTA